MRNEWSFTHLLKYFKDTSFFTCKMGIIVITSSIFYHHALLKCDIDKGLLLSKI